MKKQKEKSGAGKVEEERDLFFQLSDPSFFSVNIFSLKKRKKKQQQRLGEFCASFERHMLPLGEQMKVVGQADRVVAPFKPVSPGLQTFLGIFIM